MDRRRLIQGCYGAVLTLVALTVAGLYFGSGKRPLEKKKNVEAPTFVPSAAVVPTQAVDKKVRIGSTGDSIIFDRSGPVWLEDSQGRRTMLLRSLPAEPIDERALIERIESRLNELPKRKKKTRLIVLDRGIIAVPHDEVITYQGSDRVTAIDPSTGESVIYYADGDEDRRKGSRDGGRPKARKK